MISSLSVVLRTRYSVERGYSWRGLPDRGWFICKAFPFRDWLIVSLQLPDFSKGVNKKVSVAWAVVYWEEYWEEIGLFEERCRIRFGS